MASKLFLLGTAVLAGLYFLRFRSLTVDRGIYAALFCVGALFVFEPSYSTMVANSLGIGRGADLVFYVFMILSLFHFISLESRLHKIEGRITASVRQEAISHPQFGAGWQS